MIRICRHCLQSKSGSVQLVLLSNCQLVARSDWNNEDIQFTHKCVISTRCLWQGAGIIMGSPDTKLVAGILRELPGVQLRARGQHLGRPGVPGGRDHLRLSLCRLWQGEWWNKNKRSIDSYEDFIDGVFSYVRNNWISAQKLCHKYHNYLHILSYEFFCVYTHVLQS